MSTQVKVTPEVVKQFIYCADGTDLNVIVAADVYGAIRSFKSTYFQKADWIDYTNTPMTAVDIIAFNKLVVDSSFLYLMNKINALWSAYLKKQSGSSLCTTFDGATFVAGDTIKTDAIVVATPNTGSLLVPVLILGGLIAGGFILYKMYK